jgi:GDP-D-mannose 3',5'-epimerase
MKRVLVTGAGGFIGHHLVTYLKKRGYWVRGADVKLPEYTAVDADEFAIADLRLREEALRVMRGIDEVYALAACVYPEHLQDHTDVVPLREEVAYPANPQDAYGWEKLVAERLCLYYAEEFGLETRIVRFHNVYGPYGTYDGGREKVPAALCRKVALAEPGGSIEVWGDGEQTRSFCHVDDCIEGIHRIMRSGHDAPLNLGTDRMVSVNQLARIIIDISGKPGIGIQHVDGPQGVRGRNSDNTRLREVIGWEPRVSLEEGLVPTYRWIEEQVAGRRAPAPDMWSTVAA